MIRTRHVQNPSPSWPVIMATYSREDFEQIAAAIRKDIADLRRCRGLFLLSHRPTFHKTKKERGNNIVIMKNHQ